MIRRLVLLVPLLAMCASAALAQDPSSEDLINPDRPGIADGSKVIGGGRFQIETSLQFERHSPDGEVFHALFFPTLLRVGMGDRFELRAEGNTFTHAAGASGVGPESIGAKIALLAPDQGTSVGVIVRAFPASGSGDFKTRHFTSDLRLAADIPLNDVWSLNPNVGVARYEGDSGTYEAGLFAMTLNYQPTPRLNPFIDIGYQSTSGAGTRAPIIIDGGVAWILGRNVQLDASLGQGLRGDVPKPFVAVGFSLRAGKGTHSPAGPVR